MTIKESMVKTNWTQTPFLNKALMQFLDAL